MTDQNNKIGIVGMIIQGGAVGVALFSLWILWSLVSDHLSYNTEVMIELKSVISENNRVMTDQSDIMDDLEKTIQIFLSKNGGK